jgi:hypothetical protein
LIVDCRLDRAIFQLAIGNHNLADARGASASEISQRRFGRGGKYSRLGPWREHFVVAAQSRSEAVIAKIAGQHDATFQSVLASSQFICQEAPPRLLSLRQPRFLDGESKLHRFVRFQHDVVVELARAR